MTLKGPFMLEIFYDSSHFKELKYVLCVRGPWGWEQGGKQCL